MGKFWILASLILFIIAAGCTASAPATTQVSEPAVEQKPVATQPVGTAVKVEPTAAPANPSEGSSSTEPSVPDDLPSIDGATLLENRCTTCHDITVVQLKSESAAEWEQIVMQMIQNGAFLTTDEKQVLIDYLAATYPEK